MAELRVNDGIRAKEVRVVAPDGSQVGVKTIQEAMYLAEGLGLDLVEVAPKAEPPVARLMDYGKYKYEQSVKDREARKNQSRNTIKEITFRVKIGARDFQIKSDRAKRFLEHGDKVRVRIWFRGREASRPQLGLTILERLTDDLVGVGKVDQEPKQEGRNMTMTFSPLPKRERMAAEEERAEEERAEEERAEEERAEEERAEEERAEEERAEEERAEEERAEEERAEEERAEEERAAGERAAGERAAEERAAESATAQGAGAEADPAKPEDESDAETAADASADDN